MIKHLGFSRKSIGDQGFVQNVQDITANLLQFLFNLVSVLLDLGNMLLGALGLLLLLDRGDDSPGCTACSDNVLVGNRQKIAFINSEFTTNLPKRVELVQRIG